MTAKVERLMNLVVALLETRRPLTLAEIRAGIAGYDQAEAESARRMFERDKEELRSLGVPIETRSLDAFDVDVGYRIDRERYAMPPVDLDASEVAALALAVQLTGEEGARLGLAKLAARAPDPAASGAPPARVDLGAGPLDGIADALVERRALAFTYRAADGETTSRTVDPYGVIQRRGAWYLVGRDHDRDALRAFRLDRMAGRARTVGDPASFEVPPELSLSEHVTGPATEGVDAEVAFAPRAAWEARRRGEPRSEREDGWEIVGFTDVDPDRFLPWVLGFGADAEVLGPPSLRQGVVERLRSVS